MRSVVFFDLVGTLIQARSSIGTQYATLAARFGLEADAAAIDRVFPAVLARSRTFALHDPRRTELSTLERRAWRDIVQAVFTDAGLVDNARSPIFDEYFAALFDHFATRAAWALYPDVTPALAALKRAGRGVGLISNFDSRVFPLLDRLGIAAALDSVTIPAIAGAAKPDAAIFRHALATHGAAAADAAYVGDSALDDLLPAQALGMAAFLIDREGSAQPPPGITRIRSLSELVRPATA